MWTLRTETLAKGQILKLRIECQSHPLTFADVFGAWQKDSEFRAFFSQSLAAIPFEAFRWETPGLTAASTDHSFECVTINSPGLASHPNPSTFAGHFQTITTEGITEFANLRGDALLVVPQPLTEDSAYGHLATFVRNAPEAQRHALWQHTGAAMQHRLSDIPVWLSTAGAGVSWLHVRLDDRPKYYHYAPYQQLIP